jgi:hypothetical protein
MENFDLYQRVSTFLEKDIKNWSYINTIEALLNVAEGFQNENGLMAEKAAEKDIAFGQFMRIIEEQKEEIRKLKNDRRLVKYYAAEEENILLATENARLKELVKA